MKKRIISLILASIICITPIISFGEDATKNSIKTTISIEDAIEIGIKNSPEIKLNEVEIEIKKVELSEANYDERKYKKSDISLGTVEGFLLDENMLSKKAEYALQEEKLKKNYIIEDIKYNVVNAYYGVLKAKEHINVVNSNLDNITRHRDIIKKKLDLGLTSKSELLITEIALNEAEINLEKAKENEEMALRALNMVLNYPLDTKLNLSSNFKEEKFSAELDKDIESSYEKRFEMIQMKNNYEIVKLDFNTNAKVYTPNTFKYKYKEGSVLRMENLLNNAKQNAEFDIRGKYDAIKSAEKQLKLAKANVEKAEEGLRLKEISYNVGMGTILEIKEAITQLYNAKLAVSDGIANYNLSIIDYNKAVNIGTVR
ncbi:TolC family protein [Tissierella praeacuta]|uniref:TolC family protein n=1 Tax=Tissierella praeacuta TaxID=43131 RepID=UPI003511D900